MDHLTEGQLQACLDGDVESAAAPGLSAHLESCAVCMRSLQSMRVTAERAARALVWLDRPASTAAAMDEGYAALRRGGTAEVVGANDDVTVRRIEAHRSWGRPARVGFLKAAMLALFASGAAAAAIPGSPVQRWLGAAWQRISGAEAESVVVPAQPAEPELGPGSEPSAAEPRAEVASIAVDPVDGAVRVDLLDAARAAGIRVVLVDAGVATIEAEAAPNIRFSTGPGRIQASGLGTGMVTVSIPRSLAHAVVRVDGQAVLEKDGAELRTSGAVVQRTGDTVIFRVN